MEHSDETLQYATHSNLLTFTPNHQSTVPSVMKSYLTTVCMTSPKYTLLPTTVTEPREPATLHLSIYPLSQLKHKTYKCRYCKWLQHVTFSFQLFIWNISTTFFRILRAQTVIRAFLSETLYNIWDISFS